jgi:hypothetical protein
MEWFVGGMGVLALVLLMGSGWFLICNDRTLRDRLLLIARISATYGGEAEYWEASRDLEAVDYNSHAWALFFFRNPKNLYTERLQRLI